MAKSFSITPDARPQPEGKRRSVLVTGASGRLGVAFSQRAAERYDLRLMVRPGESAEAIASFGEVVECDLGDLPGLKKVCEGIDTIVHLAAEPSPFATWASILPNNVVGTYNVFVAAKSAACRRVVFASSIHAVSGYPADVQVKTSDPANPGDLYGVSKVFGEALGRYMAEQEGVSCIAIRIGAAGPIEWASHQRSLYMMDAFLSYDDLQQLIERSIDDERVQFAIVHGVSDNRFKRLDISTTRTVLGYQPKDDLARVNPVLRDLELNGLQSHSLLDGFPSGIRDDI
ncbi:MAG: NAD-dependent epimerase/dehydratase family protein [Fimbriimonas sp.]